ncbi:MAG TPA: hypothetical protein VGS41_11080 [Chthonomonadales bacterium]|nr:hypothetical protein [Chthonomonadales bacterium]
MRTLTRLCISAAALIYYSAAAIALQSPRCGDAPARSCQALAPVAQKTFEFHNDFWVNLHHTLYNQAALQKAGHPPDLSTLSQQEASEWNRALDYYGRNLIGRSLLDYSMVRINTALAHTAETSRLTQVEDRALRELLENAAPIYRAHWWPAQQRSNQEWMDRISPLVARCEDAVKPALSHAYNSPWPHHRIRVEISYYTTGVSAYTSLRPTLITISSWSKRNQDTAAVETLFHEASHSLIRKVADEIQAYQNRTGKKLTHGDLWHAVIFYTTGEIVGRCEPDLVPYAIKYGMWDTAWPNTLPALDKDWRPYLEGKAKFKASIDRLVADLQ